MPDNLFDLTGKVTLVTGGNSGIGLGFAMGVAKCGSDVMIWGRSAEKNASATETLRELGVRAESACVDVADEEQVVTGIRGAVTRMGRLDCVIANAGIATKVKSFVDMSTSEYKELLDINQHGAFYTLREAARHMVSRSEQGDPGGSLIVCGSMTTLHGTPGMQHYAAAKGALASIMRCTAVEYGVHGIRANMVIPGYIVTGMTSGNERVPKDFADQLDRQMAEKAPLGRVGFPADFEGIAAYLASDASSYQTGTLTVIDGGRTATA